MLTFNQMDLNGAMLGNVDYGNIEDLDPETLEDVEVALYGMLHHASCEEDYTVIPEANSDSPHQNHSLSPTLPELKSSTRNLLEQPTPTTIDNICKIEPVSSGSFKSNEDGKRLKKKSKEIKSSSPKKSLFPRKTISNKNDSKNQLRLKKNPYSQYLIIEGNSAPSSLKETSCEVITLSDEEDSKYACINKSTSLRSTKIKDGGFNKVSSTSHVSPSSNSTLDGSESDSSVVLLDSLEGTSSPNFDTSSLSSDSSDSDIEFLESSRLSYTNVNLKLNVSQTDNIDSQLMTCINPSESKFNWEKYCSTKWTPDMIQFYDKSDKGPDLDAILRSFPKNIKWYLDDEDRRGSSLQRNRYFGKSARMRCTNCNQWDHATKSCREPRKICGCGICGMPGHKSFGCPKKVCLGCGRPNKILIECCPECRRESSVVCMICRSKHVTQRCPDLWRRYHSTTGQDDNPKDTGTALKPDHQLFCCNCSGRGHLVHECPEKRWSKYTPVNPTVVSYENPRNFLNNVTNEGKSSIAISEDRKEIWVVGQSRDSSPKKGGHQSYAFSLNYPTSEIAMRTAKNSVLQEIKHVNIVWRKQPKKGRMLVEFTGNGDTKEAKMRFKKIIAFQKKADVSPGRKKNTAQEDAAAKGSTMEKVNTHVAAKTRVGSTCITAVHINHVSRDGRQMRRHVRVNLTEKEKRNVGKLLGKLEFKHRVQITSCYMGKKWEVTIHKLPNGNSSAALHSIVDYLDASSTRPGGA